MSREWMNEPHEPVEQGGDYSMCQCGVPIQVHELAMTQQFGELRITEEGVAVVESGLTLRQAHELKTGCSGDDLCRECRTGSEATR